MRYKVHIYSRLCLRSGILINFSNRETLLPCKGKTSVCRQKQNYFALGSNLQIVFDSVISHLLSKCWLFGHRWHMCCIWLLIRGWTRGEEREISCSAVLSCIPRLQKTFKRQKVLIWNRWNRTLCTQITPELPLAILQLCSACPCTPMHSHAAEQAIGRLWKSKKKNWILGPVSAKY